MANTMNNTEYAESKGLTLGQLGSEIASFLSFVCKEEHEEGKDYTTLDAWIARKHGTEVS